jgi:hypothetical protein
MAGMGRQQTEEAALRNDHGYATHPLPTAGMRLQRKRQTTSLLLAILLVFVTCTCFAGSAQTPQQTSVAAESDPAVVYEDAIRPFETIRHASQNWSDVERAAFVSAGKHAKEGCESIKPAGLAPGQLIEYARLCAFGGDWEVVRQSSADYLALPKEKRDADQGNSTRLLSTAFDFKIQAELRLQKPDEAFADSRTMLQAVPYNFDTAEALDSAIGYLQFSDPERALALIRDRHPVLLARIGASNHFESNADPSQNIPTSTLYKEALLLPTVLQYRDRPEEAATELEKLEASLPSRLPLRETKAISNERNRYLLLGRQLPVLTTAGWLMALEGAGTLPDLKAPGQATAILIFPDWCTQCLALRPKLIETWKRLRADDNRFFTLLATDETIADVEAKNAPVKTKSLNEQKRSATHLAPFAGENAGIPHLDMQLGGDNRPIALLRGTPTFLVPSNTLQSFFTSEVPFLVVIDSHRLIRVLQAAGDNYLEAGGALDQMMENVKDKWPSH